MVTGNENEYNGLWVFVEQRGGKPAQVSLELLGKGHDLAESLEVDVTAILIGRHVSEIAEELIFSGADRVIIADDAIFKDYRTEVYTEIIETRDTVDWSNPCRERFGTEDIGTIKYRVHRRLY